jgi:hypothetical protein
MAVVCAGGAKNKEKKRREREKSASPLFVFLFFLLSKAVPDAMATDASDAAAAEELTAKLGSLLTQGTSPSPPPPPPPAPPAAATATTTTTTDEEAEKPEKLPEEDAEEETKTEGDLLAERMNELEVLNSPYTSATSFEELGL